MAYVEVGMSPRSVLLYPKKITEYPTFAYFERGYFKAQVNYHTIWFDIEKIVKDEYL